MSAIALLIEPGKLVGFLLLANATAMSEAPTTSDCIFTGIPSDKALISNPLSEFVQTYKNIEFRCKIERQEEGILLTVRPSENLDVNLKMASDGVGHWQINNGGHIESGFCELAKK